MRSPSSGIFTVVPNIFLPAVLCLLLLPLAYDWLEETSANSRPVLVTFIWSFKVPTGFGYDGPPLFLTFEDLYWIEERRPGFEDPDAWKRRRRRGGRYGV